MGELKALAALGGDGDGDEDAEALEAEASRASGKAAAAAEARAAVAIQRKWRGRSSQLSLRVRIALKALPKEAVASACAGGLDAIAELLSSTLSVFGARRPRNPFLVAKLSSPKFGRSAPKPLQATADKERSRRGETRVG